MTSMHGDPKSGPPRLTRAGLMLGVKAALPLMAGVVVFGLAFGASSAQKGLTLTEAMLMSAVVYGGIVRFVTLEVRALPMTSATIAALALVTAIVNLRYVLMGAALRPWLGRAPHAHFVAGWWFLIADALAGCITGGFVDDE